MTTTLTATQESLGGPVTVSLRMCFPESACNEPILSELITQHGLTVNVRAALLGGRAEGWFDLEVSGDRPRVEEAIASLQTFDAEISFGDISEGQSPAPAPLQLPPNLAGPNAGDSLEPEIDQRVWVRIPRDLCDRPILSGLMARDNLRVNILGALLQSDGRADGRFDLHLSGPGDQVEAAIADLESLGIEVWRNAEADF